MICCSLTEREGFGVSYTPGTYSRSSVYRLHSKYAIRLSLLFTTWAYNYLFTVLKIHIIPQYYDI